MSEKNYTYEIALSFAGEDREYVAQVATSLRSNGIEVFYDEYEAVSLWGKNLYTHLHEVYQNKAKYTIIFVSKHYARKLWPNHERESAQARAFRESSEYILPARFDDSKVPGMPNTVGYIDLRKTSPLELATLIMLKLGRQPEDVSPTINRDAILGLISNVQNKNIPLSESIAQSLTIAHQIADQKLVKFCTNELIGYHEWDQDKLENLDHRRLEAYCSPAMLNPQYHGFVGNASAMFTYMESQPGDFVKKIFVIQFSVSQIEQKLVDLSPGKYIKTIAPLSAFNPDADNGDLNIYCYSQGNGYHVIIENIRARLTQFLLEHINAA